VTLSDRRLAWEDDLLHVKRELIETNVSRMIEAYRPDAVVEPATDVAKRVSDAAEAFSLGDDHAAIHFLEPIREFTKSNADLGFFYAELCIRLKRLDDAKEVLNHLPDDMRRTRLDAILQIRSGNAAQGLESLVELTRDAPQNTAAWQALVEAYQALDRRDDALATMRAWIDAQPHFAEPWRQLAQLHRDSGDFVQAEKAYVRAIETVQNSQPTYLLLQFAKFLIDRGRFTDAAATLAHIHPSSLAELRHRTTLQLLLPEDALAKVAESQVTTSIGSDAKLDAEEEAVMAAEQDAKQLRTAIGHWRSGRFEEAIAAASPLVERPVRLQAQQVIARSLTRLSRWPEAEAQWRALFDGGVQDADTCAALASVLIEQGRLEEALPYFRNAYSKSPRFAHSMASLLLATGAPEEALGIVENELSARPSDEALLKLRQRIGVQRPATAPQPTEV
ncbi:MAG TPA: tetratricopeptide repeat protein, partial [Acidobacteriaceae bacterium]|nr:tetratricopeptide repeat protein [Acidobacteriaceae bacterium]